ncbi:MAG TPA: PilN domain-containing protein [Candidatus Paceibacterota bacterium]|nr:PilN domain-containing protein [Candidatus Paceibacterota bacterium]
MPLPEKVIEQLGREPSGTQGWASGALFFSGGVLFLAIAIYIGLTFGYEPYLQSQLTSVQDQISALNQSISASDQSQLIGFYSQIANLQTLLQNHRLSSQLFSWLEQNTEANIYYQSLALTAGNQVTLAGVATSEADINQQVAIFENSPEVSSVTVSDVSAPQLLASGWSFSMTLVMNPSVFLASSQ